MKKRILAIALSVLLVLSCLPLMAFAADGSGTEGEPWLIGTPTANDVTAWLSADGKTLTIEGKGTGVMQDFGHSGMPSQAPWVNDGENNITTVVIGSGVTYIGQNAFEECSNVANLYIDSIESWCGITLGSFTSNPFNDSIVASSKQKLFVGNKETTDLVIPDGVTTVKDYAFFYWEMLTSVEMPSVTDIKGSAFESCSGLTSVKMPSVESIGRFAFKACEDLTSVEMPSVTSIDQSAFENCFGLTSVDIGSTISGTLYSTFAKCDKLKSVVIRAATPPTMGDAFDRCDALAEIIVPNASVEDYKAANGWKTHEDIIIGAYFVDTDIKGQGTVTASKKYVAAADYVADSETITLTVTPDDGYQLKEGTLKVNGGTITLTGNTFKMPAANVTVTAEFEAAVTHTLTVKNGEADATAGTDYAWDGNVLHIKKSGLTVSGETATENIVVDSGVSTLTLNGVKIIPTNVMIGAVMSNSDDLTINIVGNCQLGNMTPPNSEDKSQLYVTDAISATGNITLVGDGYEGTELVLYGTNGIHVTTGNVAIKDLKVSVNSGSAELDPGNGVGENGIYVATGNVTISGTADVAVGGHDYGIYVDKGTVRIGTASTDTIAVSADGYFGGIRVADGDIEINTGTVKARAHKWGIGVGKKVSVDGEVLGSGNITISGQNTKVVAFGGIESPVDTEKSEEYNYKWGCGIYALGVTGGDKGAVTIKDGAGVIAKGYDYGIGAENKVSIQGAMTNVSAEGGYSYGLEEKDSFVNNAEDVFAYGIFSNDKIVVMGGTVAAKGCDGAMNKAPTLQLYQTKIDGVDTPSWRVLAGDNAEKAVRTEDAAVCTTSEYAEIFSMILKEKLDVDDSGKILIGYSKVGATEAKLACYGVFYDKDNKILKLDGFMQNMSAVELTVEEDANNAYAIRLPDGATLELNGKNTIQAPHTTGNKSCGILGAGVLCIKSGKESGSLTLTAGNAPTTKGKSFGIYSSGDLSIDGSVKLNVTAGNGKVAYGISGAEDISITSGTISVKNGDATNTIAVAVDEGKTLTVGAIGKTAQLKNVKGGLTESAGIVTSGKLTAATGTSPMVISFVPIIVVEKKDGADYPVAGKKTTEYQLYAVSVENFASDPTLKLEWWNGDAWTATAPTGVTLGTDGKITTTAGTVMGTYIFRITNNVDEFIDDPAPNTPNPAFVSSGEITLTIEEGHVKCEYDVALCLTETTMHMVLDGCDKGEFTFIKNGKGWSIMNSEGNYLGLKDGKLTLSSVPFKWSYAKDSFSATETVTVTTPATKILFIRIPGTTKKVTTTYYLNTVKEGDCLSLLYVFTGFYKHVESSDHTFTCPTDCKNGTHMQVCIYCGEILTEEHHFDNGTHRCICGAYDPAFAHIDVSASVKSCTTKKATSLIGLIFGKTKTVTTYTATISAKGVGLNVTKVEYATSGNNWKTGCTFTSNDPITSFKIRVTASDGRKEEYIYIDGNVYPAN